MAFPSSPVNGQIFTADGKTYQYNSGLWDVINVNPNIDVSDFYSSATIDALLSAKADDAHTHFIANVTGLQDALDAKLAASSYTAADVLVKTLTVDGAGSGLDADLLDGQHASAFALAGHTHVDLATVTALTDGLALKADATALTSGLATKLGSTAKATDSSLLDGLAQNTASVANTIVRRDASASFAGATITATNLAQTSSVTTRGTDTRFISSTDATLRWNDAAGFLASLGTYSAAAINALLAIAESSEFTIPTTGDVVWTHGLGGTPRLWDARVRCKTAESGYIAGDELSVASGLRVGTGSTWISAKINSVSIGFYGWTAQTDFLVPEGNASETLTKANWRLVFYAKR